jgi:hypothetical protein
MSPEDRAREGVFMAFQYPVEIAGVNNAYFLKAALNAKRKHHGQPELDAVEFMQLIREKAKDLDIDQGMVLKVRGEMYYGADAIHMLSLLSTRSGWFNRLCFVFFGTRVGARIFYPVGKAFQEGLFKQGIDENIEETDFQSHYDLGVAYKESGELEKAVSGSSPIVCSSS